LLENVEMGAKWERILSEAIGVFGVHINSALVSAQNRKRIYWTNIRTKQVGLFGELHSDIPQPKDREILLKDILESEVDEKYYLSNIALDYIERGKERGRDRISINDGSDKTTCLTQNYHKGVHNQGETYVCVAKDNLVMQINPSLESGGKQPYQHNRIYDTEGISPCLNTDARPPAILTENYLQLKGNGFDSDNRFFYEDGKHGSVLTRGEDKTGVVLGSKIRRLTPTECARLQTIPDWYVWICSDTQQYRMLGNGWTVEVIKHILSFGNFKSINQYEQTKH